MLQTVLDLVAIEKVASVDYLDKVMACYRDGRIAVPCDAGTVLPEGYEFRERITPAPGGGWFALAQAPRHDDAPAQVSFSSGTTGQPKAILLSNRALGDVTDRLIAAMEIDGEIREYLGVPPTYSFGLARARVAAAVGGQLYVPPRGFDPTEFARMLEAGEVNALSAVPTLLRALMSIPDLIPRKAGRQLRWLEIGSQPMSADEKQAIRRLFPAARIIQHYGLTEASRTTFLDIQEASAEELETVGRPIGKTEVRIDAEDRICIRGPHVADGVLTGEGLQPLVDSDGWLTTNDLGRIDEKGFLTFLGRADHLLNVGGIKVSAELFEQRLCERLGADGEHVAIAARPDALRGQTVMVAYLPKLAAAPLAEQARAVGQSFGLGAADVTLIEVDAIPRTDTGKIQRSVLTERHGARAPAAEPAAAQPSVPAAADASGTDAPMTEREREIAAIWRDALGMETVRRDSNFFDLGGDSLSAISVMLKMERAGIPKEITQLIFQGRTVAEIAAYGEGQQPERQVHRAETSDAITMVRGLLVLCVIAGHWTPFLLLRAGSYSGALLHWTSPFFRFGTPGFAMIFGIGLAYFGLPLLQRQPERLRANVRTNSLLLCGGVLTLGIANIIFRLIGGQSMGPTWISHAFYNVLTAYLLLVLTSPLFLKFINRQRYPMLATLGLAFLSFGVSAVLRGLWGDANTVGVVDFARLLIIAKYGYPEMLCYVLSGVALGIWIDRAHEDEDLPKVALLVGGVLVVGAMALTAELDLWDRWFENTASAPMLIAYAGAVLILFSLILEAIRRGYSRGSGRAPFRLLGAIGVLAFLFYVGQELVMIVNNGLQGAGLSRPVALSIPLALFLIMSWAAIRRLYRLYHG